MVDSAVQRLPKPIEDEVSKSASHQEHALERTYYNALYSPIIVEV
jgi:hypothetical protein